MIHQKGDHYFWTIVTASNQKWKAKPWMRADYCIPRKRKTWNPGTRGIQCCGRAKGSPSTILVQETKWAARKAGAGGEKMSPGKAKWSWQSNLQVWLCGKLYWEAFHQTVGKCWKIWPYCQRKLNKWVYEATINFKKNIKFYKKEILEHCFPRRSSSIVTIVP